MDVTEEFLADSLKKALEKKQEPPGIMGNAELKKIAELMEGVKTLQAGGLLGASPSFKASGAGIPEGLFSETLGSASAVNPFEAFEADGLTTHRAVEIAKDGRMVARQKRDQTPADFFFQWSQYVMQHRGSATGESLEEYVSFLRFLTDLGFDFRDVVDFDLRTRHGWMTGKKVVVDRANLGVDFLLRQAVKARGTASTTAAGDRPVKSLAKCRNFNTKRGCTFVDCKFLHQCSVCQRSGHAAPACPHGGKGTSG